MPLAVTGGIVLHCDSLLGFVERELESLGRPAAPLTRVEEPVRGAVLLAQRETA
jgi:hypothetical protein